MESRGLRRDRWLSLVSSTLISISAGLIVSDGHSSLSPKFVLEVLAIALASFPVVLLVLLFTKSTWTWIREGFGLDRSPSSSVDMPISPNNGIFDIPEKTTGLSISNSATARIPESNVLSPGDSPSTDSIVATPQSLGTKWLEFWNYICLPVGGIFGILSSVANGFIMAPVYIVELLVAYGLHHRQMWAWQCNWIFIMLAWIGMATPNEWKIFSVFEVQSNPPSTTESVWFQFGFSFVVLGFIWMWPNYVYWNKRRRLFRNNKRNWQA